MKAALRDAGLSALVALGLFGPMIGLKTESGPGGLYLDHRPWALAAAVATVFFGRFALLAWRGTPREGYAFNRSLAERLSHAGRFLTPALLIMAVALPFVGSRYVIDTGVIVLTYVMLGWGLNIVVGLAGLLDLGYVAFYAIGAYTFALLSQHGFGFWSALPLCGLAAALFGVLLGFPVLRLRGDYLAIVTLAFGEIIRLVLLNAVSVTGGPQRHRQHPPAYFVWPEVHRIRRRGYGRGLPRRPRRPDRVQPHAARRLPLFRHPGPRFAHQLGVAPGSAASRWAARGRRCGRTRSPAGASAST